jgi:hypothetical protein
MPISKRLSDYSAENNKAVLFFSASSTGDTEQLLDFGIHEILVSYYYMRKSLPYYEKVLDELQKCGGLFMTDSGAFSFMGGVGADISEMTSEKYWIPYLTEYVDWLRAHKDKIFCAANLDLDKLVGRDVVRRWNEEYFEPLEKEGLQIVYVAHEDEGDPHAIKHFREYCKRYRYVGVNQTHKDYAAKFYQAAKEHNVRVHGFAWTELNILKHNPFFSVDSTTWLGGVRYGTTYDYDGKNFRTIDYKHKHIRKLRALKYKKIGVSLDDVLGEEKRKPVNRMNLLGWMGFRKEFLKMANLKLHNRTVAHYK